MQPTPIEQTKIPPYEVNSLSLPAFIWERAADIEEVYMLKRRHGKQDVFAIISTDKERHTIVRCSSIFSNTTFNLSKVDKNGKELGLKFLFDKFEGHLKPLIASLFSNVFLAQLMIPEKAVVEIIGDPIGIPAGTYKIEKSCSGNVEVYILKKKGGTKVIHLHPICDFVITLASAPDKPADRIQLIKILP